jgi:hypothetical protein
MIKIIYREFVLQSMKASCFEPQTHARILHFNLFHALETGRDKLSRSVYSIQAFTHITLTFYRCVSSCISCALHGLSATILMAQLYKRKNEFKQVNQGAQPFPLPSQRLWFEVTFCCMHKTSLWPGKRVCCPLIAMSRSMQNKIRQFVNVLPFVLSIVCYQFGYHMLNHITLNHVAM